MPVLLFLLLITAGVLLPVGTGSFSSGDDTAEPVPPVEGRTPGDQDLESIALGEPLTPAEYTRQVLELTARVTAELNRIDPSDPVVSEAGADEVAFMTASMEGITPPPARREQHAALVASLRSLSSSMEDLAEDPDDEDAATALVEERGRYDEAVGALGIVP